MSKKIVSIVMTVFMLVMCVATMMTLSLVNMKQNQDQIVERASSSVISTGNEVSESDSAVVRGSSLISYIVGIDQIDSRISENKDKIYSYVDSTNLTDIGIYSLNLDGKTDKKEIVDSIDEKAYYKLDYEFKDAHTIGIKISRVEK